MSVIRIESFGGEYPSLSGQALPPEGAQRNVNLYSAIREFRPLMEDKPVISVAAGVKSIYRTQRNGAGYNGIANEAVSSTWRVSQKELSYVKGQVNDDATERTYFTTDDGSLHPQAIDVASVSPRKLGVPAPASTAAAIVTGKSFTSEDSGLEIKRIAQTIKDAIIECTIAPSIDQKGARYTNFVPANGVPRVATLIPRAGPKSNYEMGPTEEIEPYLPPSYQDMHWKLHAIRPLAEMEDIFGKQGIIDLGVMVASQPSIPIDALPFCLIPDKPDGPTGKLLLEKRLRSITNAKDGTALFDDTEIANMLSMLVDGSRPSQRMPDLLAQMDECIKTFAQLVFNTNKSDLTPTGAEMPKTPTQPTGERWVSILVGVVMGKITRVQVESAPWIAYGIAKADYEKEMDVYNALAQGRPWPAPIKPSQPTTPQFLSEFVGIESGGTVQREADAWIYYRAALEYYNRAIQAYNAREGDYGQAQIGMVSKIAALQAKATDLSAQIERKVLQIYTNEMTDLDNLERALISGFGGSDNLFGGLDDKRVKEARFYVSTYVTDWGEESAPSAPSAMIEPTQYDTVDLVLSPPPEGRHVQKIRVYRSNSGTSGAVFQFLAELEAAQVEYSDSLNAAQLGEGLATSTWLEPPEKLIGLMGMPNGIMAGFLDNTVAFCHPYHPYAWPLEYQITTEHPIVGLATFGQTLFVGTTGSPYFISGSDSSSMSALKMESNQACVSRRSIVAVQGGVLYASPDGLCVADGRGVSVMTQGLFTREDWQKLQPESMIAAEHEGIYYLSHAGSGGGAFTFDMASKKLSRLGGFSPSALFVDRFSDALYYVDASSGSLQRMHGGSVRRTGLWKSGRNPMAQHAALAWVQVEGFPSVADPVHIHLYGDNYFVDQRGEAYEAVNIGTPTAGWRRLRDGVLFIPGTPAYNAIRHTVTLTNCFPARLPPGRWRDHEIEIESRASVTRVTLAGSLEELKSV